MDLSASEGDEECKEVPTRISPWLLPPDEAKNLFKDGYGTSPHLVYARGMTSTPDPVLNNVNKMRCTLILAELCFFAETSDATPNSRRRPRNTPPSSRL